MAGLLRLARTVGPYVAILQIHADIIDDWSLEGAQRLACHSRRYGFLIWEGGRVLNAQRRSGGDKHMSCGEITREIEMSRKRYTKGLVSVAAWAELVSTWVIGPEEQGSGSERLIPTLRQAAKETVALMTASVRTEISTGGREMVNGINGMPDYGLNLTNGTFHHDEDDIQYSSSSLEGFRESRTLHLTADDLGLSYPDRKASVISLTQTITQHTEPSTPSSTGVEDDISEADEENDLDDRTTTPTLPLPEPPLLSRGVVICLPSGDDKRYSSEYRRTALESAKTHKDFVVGFVSDESWIDVYGRQDFDDLLVSRNSNEYEVSNNNNHHGDGNDSDDDSVTHEESDNEPETLIVFSPLENDHITRSNQSGISAGAQGLNNLYLDTTTASSRYPRQSQQITTLHQLIGRALSVRNSISPPPCHTTHASSSSSSALQNGNLSRHDEPEVIYIPVISMS